MWDVDLLQNVDSVFRLGRRIYKTGCQACWCAIFALPIFISNQESFFVRTSFLHTLTFLHHLRQGMLNRGQIRSA